jgi:hypothetical protein
MNLFKNARSPGDRAGRVVINLGAGGAAATNGGGYRKASLNTINTVNSTKLSEVVNNSAVNQR